MHVCMYVCKIGRNTVDIPVNGLRYFLCIIVKGARSRYFR